MKKATFLFMALVLCIGVALVPLASASAASNQWKKEGTSWYLYNGSKKLTGWQKDGGQWYYLDKSGAMKTGWQRIDGKWYFMYSSGAMLTGWLQRPEGWYYMMPSGEMNERGTLLLSDGVWYVFDDGLWTGYAG